MSIGNLNCNVAYGLSGVVQLLSLRFQSFHADHTIMCCTVSIRDTSTDEQCCETCSVVGYSSHLCSSLCCLMKVAATVSLPSVQR